MEIDQKLKEFEWVINHFNSRGKWLITKKQVKEELLKSTEFSDMKNIPQWLTNVFQRYERNGMAIKTNMPSTYFAFIKYKYPLINDIKFNSDKHKISSNVIKYIEKLNLIKDKEKLDYIYSKESLFSTIIENSTLDENNIEFRKLDIEDPEVTEYNNIKDCYVRFSNSKQKLTDILLKEIHSYLFKHLYGTERYNSKTKPGNYVESQNFISGGLLPCDINHKLPELKEFFKFYNEKPKDINDAFIRLAKVSYWFAGIHIFADGNSRTGRFLLSYYLYLHGITKNMNFTVSRTLDSLGGKSSFIKAQVRSWEEKDINLYIKWFINQLINISWTTYMEEIL